MWTGPTGQLPAIIGVTVSGDTHHNWLMIARTKVDFMNLLKWTCCLLGPSCPQGHLINDWLVDWLILTVRRVHKPGHLWVPCFIQDQYSQHFPNYCLLTPLDDSQRKEMQIDWLKLGQHLNGMGLSILKWWDPTEDITDNYSVKTWYQQDNRYRQWQREPLQRPSVISHRISDPKPQKCKKRWNPDSYNPSNNPNKIKILIFLGFCKTPAMSPMRNNAGGYTVSVGWQ